MTIHNMRDQRPAYNLISNNCQNFAVNLLDNIQLGATREFATTFEIYRRATGKGSIKDLFVDEQSGAASAALEEDEGQIPKSKRQKTIFHARRVMDENTTKLHDG